METGMTQKELDRVAVLALRRSGQITQTEAATRLGVSERQVRRLERRIAAGGSAALRSGHRGTAGNRRIAPELMTKALDLIREHYKGFGPTLAAEYLESRHGILVSKETLRQHMSPPGSGGPNVALRLASTRFASDVRDSVS